MVRSYNRKIILEDGGEYPLGPGEAEYCPPGHSHGMRNDSDETAQYLAVTLL